jgi:Na+-translocating ferredoxin:NAD+ oxidoreductase RnfG subunit
VRRSEDPCLTTRRELEHLQWVTREKGKEVARILISTHWELKKEETVP